MTYCKNELFKKSAVGTTRSKGVRSAYKKPTRVESVDIDAEVKAGHVVDPAREMQVSDMVTGGPATGKPRCF